ncbi:MAG TPA: peptide chain release factor aRF-1 [Oculatellaceae cyanobacterium]
MGTEKITHFYGCKLTSTNSAKQHKLRKLIAELSGRQAASKEFISLYIPKQVALDAVIEDLKKQDTDCNSASKEENRRREDAMKNVIKHLKAQKQTLENGQAIFAGTMVDNSGNEVLNVEELTPPTPITQYLTAIDSHFILEPLRDMLRDQRITGLILLDAKEAQLSILIGGNLQPVGNLTSGVPGKTGKGGQSQRRYERERNMELTNWFHRIAEHADAAFLENHHVTNLIVGGPGQTKNDFLKADFLNYQLKKLLLKVIDTQPVGNQATLEMLDKSADALVNMCGPEEKSTMQRLEVEINKQEGLAVCGLDAVLESLKQGTTEVAILTDNSGLYEALFTCRKCGLPKSAVLDRKDLAANQKMTTTPCTRCNATDYERAEKDMVDVLEDAAAQTNARVEVIFTDSEEKAKLKSLGGFAALLRYRTSQR